MVKLLPLSTPKVAVFEGRELLSRLRNQFLSCYTLCSEFVLFQPKILYSFEGFLLLQEAKFFVFKRPQKNSFIYLFIFYRDECIKGADPGCHTTSSPAQDLLPLSILSFLVAQGRGGERIAISSSWIWIGNVDGS